MICDFSYSVINNSIGKIDCCGYIDNNDGYITKYQMNISKVK